MPFRLAPPVKEESTPPPPRRDNLPATLASNSAARIAAAMIVPRSRSAWLPVGNVPATPAVLPAISLTVSRKVCAQATWSRARRSRIKLAPDNARSRELSPQAGHGSAINNFFGSTSYVRCRGVFRAAPFDLPFSVACVLGQICCYNDRLPQGTATSPVVSNYVCRGLDGAFEQLAKRSRARYTRYADDMTFSFSVAGVEDLPTNVVTLRGRAEAVVPCGTRRKSN